MKTEHAIDWSKTAQEIQDDYEAVCKQRDELLNALKRIREDGADTCLASVRHLTRIADKAIASVKGGE